MLKKWGEYLVNNRLLTVVLVLAMSAAPLLGLPFLYMLAWVVMAFVALRMGAVASIPVLLCTMLPAAVSYAHHEGNSLLILCHWLLGPVLLWMLACLLCYTVSWRQTLQYGACAAALIALGLHFLLHKEVLLFMSLLKPMVTQILQSKGQADAATVHKAWLWLQQNGAGLWVAVSYMIASVLLIVARVWQSMAYNPGGWTKEFLTIRFDKVYTLALALIVLLSFVGVAWLQNVIFVMMWSFVFSGLSVMHTMLLVWSKQNVMWVVAFYVVTVLFLSVMAVVMMFSGMVDSLVNVRKLQRQ